MTISEEWLCDGGGGGVGDAMVVVTVRSACEGIEDWSNELLTRLEAEMTSAMRSNILKIDSILLEENWIIFNS